MNKAGTKKGKNKRIFNTVHGYKCGDKRKYSHKTFHGNYGLGKYCA